MSTPTLEELPPGTRVRVVNRSEINFDDYDNGDFAIVVEAKALFPGFVSMRVRWEVGRFINAKMELNRCNTLYAEEVEVVPTQ